MRLISSQLMRCRSGSNSAVGKRFAQAHGILAFTLAEMLVVIAIIAIIATIAIPGLEGLTKSNTMATATRQLLDDVAFARQKAISGRTTVYMVFLPPEFWDGVNSAAYATLNTISKKQADTLLSGQCTSYALYVERSLGDQPGRYATNYITAWRSLPDGVLIETNKFNLDTNNFEIVNDTAWNPADRGAREFEIRSFQRRFFPFPATEITNVAPRMFELPYIAFTPQGGLPQAQFPKDEFIPLTPGSVFVITNNAGVPLAPDVVQNAYRETTGTNFTLVRIDALTGRAKLEKKELQ